MGGDIGKLRATGLFGVGLVLFLLGPVIGHWLMAAFGLPEAGRLVGWLVVCFAFIGLFILLGVVLMGLPSGILIDRRNRYSLSRFQVTLWTCLVLPTIYAVLLTNLVYSNNCGTTLGVDWQLLVLMGISISSFIASPTVLSLKAKTDPNPDEARQTVRDAAIRENVAERELTFEGQVLLRKSARDAALSDLFRGEETGNGNNIDIARIQMLALTLIVWVVYALQLMKLMLSNGDFCVISLPDLNETALTLIGISHGGYILAKGIPNSGNARSRAAKDLARINTVNNRASAFLTAIRLYIGNTTTMSEEDIMPKHMIDTAEDVLAEAKQLNDEVASGSAVTEKLERLSGRLDALETSFNHLKTSPHIPPADKPSAELVRNVKDALSKAGYSTEDAQKLKWTPTDRAALRQFWQDNGVPNDAVPPTLIAELEIAERMLGVTPT